MACFIRHEEPKEGMFLRTKLNSTAGFHWRDRGAIDLSRDNRTLQLICLKLGSELLVVYN